MDKRLFTSESVTEGHPDKVCDKISDTVLDAYLTVDENCRVAVETCCNTGFVLVMGEVTAKKSVDIEPLIRKAVLEIGYDDEAKGFDGAECQVMIKLDRQSDDIALGVDASLEEKSGLDDVYGKTGAGDQGIVYGFACNDTAELMPMPIALSHRLSAKLSEVRKSGVLPYLRPDGKAQVTVEYEDGKPTRVEAVVVSAQHDESVSIEKLREDIRRVVIDAVIPSALTDVDTKYYINPTGRFVIGGPHGDSGVTGRKIIVDTYGGFIPHGGGAFSGKDATKVDRSACYMARYVCKNVVAAGLADKCRLDIAYAIGVANPVAVQIDTYGTGKLNDARLGEIVREVFDLRPAAIIEALDLRKPTFVKTTNYGHFGREGMGFKWEERDKVDVLRRAAGIR